MRKITFLITTLLIIHVNLFSQSCLPNGITFSLQSEIDNFHTNYPNCSEIEGNVTIQGNDITNLNGLSVLTTINGYLKIDFLTNLTSLSGLDNLTTINGSLHISINSNLLSINSLNNLSIIGGYLRIQDNDELLNLNGLENITTLTESLYIINNDNLSNLSGLDNLSSVENNIDISNNIKLINLIGLNNLTIVDGHIKIQGNELLENLSGLNRLETVGSYFRISSNTNLLNLFEISELSSVGSYFMVDWNTNLTTLEGFNASINGIYITDNPQLSTCNVIGVCSYLENQTGLVEIFNNSTGCNTDLEILTKCIEWLPNNDSEPLLVIYPNPSNKKISIKLKDSFTIYQAIIYNSIGQIVLHKNNGFDNIDISNLRKGLYIVELDLNGLKLMSKLIIK